MTGFARRSRGMLVFFAALASTPALAETTLWLVRPLYPGQEALVDRTEKALSRLFAPGDRKEHVVGMAELAAALKERDRKVEQVPCLTMGERCADPIDPFVAQLGFDRVVLVQGGQDEAGFKFRVAAYEPSRGKVTPATATAPVLEKALLGAVAKVVPVASTLEVKSDPPGATVYVDDTKMGVTPLSTQVLPGERTVKLDLKLHQPVEETLVVPIRGSASLDRKLDKVAARLVVTASPAGTSIFLDGELLGKDRVDRGIQPGKHTVRLSADNHKAYEQTIEVKPDEQFVLDKPLEPLPGAAVAPAPAKGTNPALPLPDPYATVRVIPPPPKPTETELTLERRSYFQASFEYVNLVGNALVGRRWGDGGTGRTADIRTPSRTLMGASVEYGTGGKYFGVTVIGLTYLTNAERYDLGVGFAPDRTRELRMGQPGPMQLDRARIHMGTIRALQPQLRFAAWRFLFQLQAGVEFRAAHITGVSSPSYGSEGFQVLDLMASARANVRFFIVEGLYFHVTGGFSYYLVGERSLLEEGFDDAGMEIGTRRSFQNSHHWGVSAGFGYGF
ncbi:MAG: PEGA domain-containing protein [Myxococcaceae bacterium]|jgi:hypothetical protein|nr:PEGA domain-containing protein [Myxococcaceae bacterium]MCA3015513.1 PEGA domain-containing protein [Myxococcaceae bacterium]